MYEDLEKRFQFSAIPSQHEMPKQFAPPVNRQYPSAKYSGKDFIKIFEKERIK